MKIDVFERTAGGWMVGGWDFQKERVGTMIKIVASLIAIGSLVAACSASDDAEDTSQSSDALTYTGYCEVVSGALDGKCVMPGGTCYKKVTTAQCPSGAAPIQETMAPYCGSTTYVHMDYQRRCTVSY